MRQILPYRVRREAQLAKLTDKRIDHTLGDHDHRKVASGGDTKEFELIQVDGMWDESEGTVRMTRRAWGGVSVSSGDLKPEGVRVMRVDGAV